jgi:hypothetical protein
MILVCLKYGGFMNLFKFSLRSFVPMVLMGCFFGLSSVAAQEEQAEVTVLADDLLKEGQIVQKKADSLRLEVQGSSWGAYSETQFSFNGGVQEVRKFIKWLDGRYEMVHNDSRRKNIQLKIDKLMQTQRYLQEKHTYVLQNRPDTLAHNDSLQELNPYLVRIQIEDPQGQVVSEYHYKTSLAEWSAPDKQQYKREMEKYRMRLEALADSLYQTTMQMVDLQQELGRAEVNVIIRKRMSAGEDSEGLRLVNMPGASFERLYMENPNPAANAEVYQGFRLKYLFTKGKSYFTVGALSALEKPENAQAVSDLFLWGLGTDFYPRYLGRGKRTFFNLYTGVELGGAIFVSEQETNHYFTAMPKLGLELLKLSRGMIDVNASYLIPFEVEKNQEYRGLLLSASLNFIF